VGVRTQDAAPMNVRAKRGTPLAATAAERGNSGARLARFDESEVAQIDAPAGDRAAIDCIAIAPSDPTTWLAVSTPVDASRRVGNKTVFAFARRLTVWRCTGYTRERKLGRAARTAADHVYLPQCAHVHTASLGESKRSARTAFRPDGTANSASAAVAAAGHGVVAAVACFAPNDADVVVVSGTGAPWRLHVYSLEQRAVLRTITLPVGPPTALSAFVLPQMQAAPISATIGKPPALFPTAEGDARDEVRLAVGLGVPERRPASSEASVRAAAVELPRLIVLDFESGAPMAEAETIAAHTESAARGHGVGAIAYCPITHTLASSSGRSIVLWE